MPVVLLNERGTPEPSPEIQRRLRAIHPRLSLRYVEVARSSWAVSLGWDSDDPRNERLRTGDLDIGQAFDIIGYLPMDASVDDAPAYLTRMFRTFPSQNVQNIADHVLNFNAVEPLKAAVDQAAGEILDSANPAGTKKGRRK